MPKRKTRPIDKAVAARERGVVLPEPAPPNLGAGRGVDHQPRGPPGDPAWLTLVRTAAYLGLSTMTIERYASDPKYQHLEFPKPAVVVDRCYWNRADIDAWMRSRIGAASSRKQKTTIATLIIAALLVSAASPDTAFSGPPRDVPAHAEVAR